MTTFPPAIIYGLECKEKKFYVGETERDVLLRQQEHLEGNGKGAAWTEKYPPVRLLFAVPKKSVGHEDEQTIQLMEEHGIENVRGGTYSSVKLPDSSCEDDC